jgi:pimeloyl-[acyl-carrier protein] methyl ester esterase
MLHVETQGSGRDIALLHGWGVTARVWSDVASMLAHRCRVHMVDLPGYGMSAACASTADEIVEHLAQSLPSRLTVCAWSLGGQLALRWAACKPRQIERLVLVATTPRFVRSSGWEHGIDEDVLTRFMSDVEQDGDGALDRFAAFQARGDRYAKSIIRQLRECAAVDCSPDTLAGGLALLKQTDLRAEVEKVAQTSLIVHGANDAVTPLPAGAWLAATMRNARLVGFAETGHAPFLSDPATFVSCVADFCDG